MQSLKENLSLRLQPFDEKWAATSGVEELWQDWRSAVLDVGKQCCVVASRKSKPGSRRSYKAQPWITDTLVCEIKMKHKLHRIYLRNRTLENWQVFTKQRNLVTRLLRDAKSQFILDSESTDGYSLTNLHTLTKCLRKTTSKSIPDLKSGDADFTSPQTKAEVLNEFFISQSQKSVQNVSDSLPSINVPAVSQNTLTELHADADSVGRILCNLDPAKSAGYDKIPTRLLKCAAKEIAPSLTCLLNASFRQASLPQDWKDATVTPVFKKGNAASPTNYRPISLLSVVAKVQERVVYNSLYAHVEPHLPDHQSGFRCNDSTELQLSRLVHQISEARDAGRTVMSCFFDLSKAFDRVWHDGLLAKLRHLGIHDTALNWFTAYLRDRRQRVRVENCFSTWSTIPAGVPQGSVLGPLLFLIYTIDLPTACTNRLTMCSQFADDTALITSAMTFAAAESSLQEAVRSAHTWLQDWHLLVNAAKTVVIIFHHANRPPEKLPDIQLGNTVLSVVSEHRHLGMLFQQNLCWDSHIHHVLAKASGRLWQFHRLRSSLNSRAMLYLYRSYIRPIVEYASLAYSSLSTTLSDCLERFQRKAARICLRLPLFTPVQHSSLLHHAELPTLSSRRKLKSILLAHSIQFRYAPSHILAIPVTHSLSPYSLRQSRTFQLPITRTDRHRDSPIHTALHNYNLLSQEYLQYHTKLSFKSAVSFLIISSICNCSHHADFSFSSRAYM